MNGLLDFSKILKRVCFSKIGHSIVCMNTLVLTFTITRIYTIIVKKIIPDIMHTLFI